MSRKNLTLELLRGLAAIMVVLVHMIPFPGAFYVATERFGVPWIQLLVSGRVAVGVFFLMSGYVLQRSSLVRGNLGSALLGRYLRLAIPTLASALLVLLLVAAGLFDFERVRSAFEIQQRLYEQIPGVLGSIYQTLVQHFTRLITPDDEWWLINPPTWTISFEFAGSILILVFSWVRSVRIRSVVAAGMAAGILALGYPHSELVFFPLSVLIVDQLEAPMRRAGSTPHGRRIVQGTLAVAILLGAYLGLFAVVTAGLFLLFLSAPSEPSTETGRRIAGTLGRHSFSIYLIHFPLYLAVLTVASHWVSRVSLLQAYAAGATIAVPLGLLGGAVGYLILLAACATVFERYVDRSAVALAAAVRRVPHVLWAP